MKTFVMRSAVLVLLLCFHAVPLSEAQSGTSTTASTSTSTATTSATTKSTSTTSITTPGIKTSSTSSKTSTEKIPNTSPKSSITSPTKRFPGTSNDIVTTSNTSPYPFRSSNTTSFTGGPTTRRNRTSPGMTTDDDGKRKMGMKKGFVVGADLGVGMSVKGYVSTWIKRLCDMVGGMVWGKGGQGQAGQGDWAAQVGVGPGGQGGWAAQVGVGPGGQGGQGGAGGVGQAGMVDDWARMGGGSAFDGAERIVPMSLLLLLLAICTHALF